MARVSHEKFRGSIFPKIYILIEFFYTASGGTKIVGLPQLGGGVDTKSPRTGCPYL